MVSQLGGQASHHRAVGASYRGPDDECQQTVGERGARPGVRERHATPTGPQRFDGVGAVGQASAGRADVPFDDAPRGSASTTSTVTSVFVPPSATVTMAHDPMPRPGPL